MNAKRAETRVESKRVETIFDEYIDDKYVVNRRYQRKLVWSLDEKEKLIDSIFTGIPIPLILVAEPELNSSRFEIIDGLQRIEAIISFIENRYAYNGHFFDLESLSFTKYLLDNGQIDQKTPKMSRKDSLGILKYELPFSIYESGTALEVDETFRRINSSGRRLGLQEVRQAGAISKTADLVRDVASSVRGDQNAKNRIPLDAMRDLSFVWGFKDGDRGINVDEVFWVKQGILRRDDLRSSQDEQIILDIVLDVYLASSAEGIINLSSTTRSAAYNSETAIAKALTSEINKSANSINLKGCVRYINDLLSSLPDDDVPIVTFLGKSPSNSIGRYYHIVFMAFFQLLYVENMEVKDQDFIADSLRGYFTERDISRGGNWAAKERKKQIDALKGVIRDGFAPQTRLSVEATAPNYNRLVDDFLSHGNESALFELKAGMFDRDMESLSGKELREALKSRFKKFFKIATAMSNTSPGEERRVIYFGIAEDMQSAKQISTRLGLLPFVPAFQDGDIPFRIIGIDHELSQLKMDSDELIRMISGWIQSSSEFSKEATEYRSLLASSLETLLVRSATGESRLVLAMRPPKFREPVTFDNCFYERVGATTKEIVGGAIFQRYNEFQYVDGQ